ncbi:MAG: F0F1 ATP synthase subunit A [Flavobacteriales bacterium]|nr:F0F1 ATP synthase subunit A [Flavobacteriales bacterium]
MLLVIGLGMTTFAPHFKKEKTMKITANPASYKVFSGFITAIIMGFLSFLPVSIQASGGEEGGKFSPGDMIMEHIQDAHSIHLIGHTSIPLPIILYTDKGIEVFMSSNFWDEHHNYIPYTSPRTGYTYANDHETIKFASNVVLHHEHTAADSTHQEIAHLDTPHIAVSSAETHATLIDFSITKSVFGMLLVLFLLVLIFTSVARKYRKGGAPKGMQNLMETLVLFIRDQVVIPSMGEKRGAKFLPLILTLFFFIWGCNMLGLIPFLGGFNITGTMSITLVLAALVFVVTLINGNGHYWGHIFWPPGVPFFVKLILVPIEIASVFIKPAVLMIRLTANITAGHIVILALVSLVFLFGSTNAAAGYGVGLGASLFIVFMFFIEILVAFLQAYVFVLLASLYFGDATQEHQHEEAHH